MISVTVIVFGTPEPQTHLIHLLDDGARVDQALAALSLGDRAAELLILVNGRHARLDTPVRAGDRISVFPRIAGGLGPTVGPSQSRPVCQYR